MSSVSTGYSLCFLKSTFMVSPDHLIGLFWDEARELAGEDILPEPLVTAPPRVKVLLGRHRVIGYRRQAEGWQMIVAAEQLSAQ